MFVCVSGCPSSFKRHLQLLPKRFGLRWFTPTNEVPLCGHATLASAACVFQAGNRHAQIEFETLSGVLKAERGDIGVIEAERKDVGVLQTERKNVGVLEGRRVITLDFPINSPEPISVEKVADIADVCLGKCNVLSCKNVRVSVRMSASLCLLVCLSF